MDAHLELTRRQDERPESRRYEQRHASMNGRHSDFERFNHRSPALLCHRFTQWSEAVLGWLRNEIGHDPQHRVAVDRLLTQPLPVGRA